MPQFASNVGTAGLIKWHGLLTAARDPKGWPRCFGEGRRAAIGLSRLYDCIQHEMTAPDAGRTLQADFLDRAGFLLGDDLSEAADGFRAAAERWHATSQLAAGADPSLGAYCQLSDDRAELLDAGAGHADLAAIREQQDQLIDGCEINAKTAADVYAAVAAEVAAIIEIERDAIAALRS